MRDEILQQLPGKPTNKCVQRYMGTIHRAALFKQPQDDVVSIFRLSSLVSDVKYAELTRKDLSRNARFARLISKVKIIVDEIKPIRICISDADPTVTFSYTDASLNKVQAKLGGLFRYDTGVATWEISLDNKHVLSHGIAVHETMAMFVQTKMIKWFIDKQQLSPPSVVLYYVDNSAVVYGAVRGLMKEQAYCTAILRKNFEILKSIGANNYVRWISTFRNPADAPTRIPMDSIVAALGATQIVVPDDILIEMHKLYTIF
jgi:hypothetical protein